MALQKRCWQVHSAVTRKVRLQKQRKPRVHAVCAKMTSGQLPFLGSEASSRLIRALARWVPCPSLWDTAPGDTRHPPDRSARRLRSGSIRFVHAQDTWATAQRLTLDRLV